MDRSMAALCLAPANQALPTGSFYRQWETWSGESSCLPHQLAFQPIFNPTAISQSSRHTPHTSPVNCHAAQLLRESLEITGLLLDELVHFVARTNQLVPMLIYCVDGLLLLSADINLYSATCNRLMVLAVLFGVYHRTLQQCSDTTSN